MDFSIESVKLSLGVFIAIVASHLGGTQRQVFVLLFLIGLDTVVGWIVAKKKRCWSSSKARWGFVGKIVELMFISMLYLIDWCLGCSFLKYVGIYYFGFCEVASVVESVAKLNSNVPQEAVEILMEFKKSFSNIIIKRIKVVLESLIKKEG